jgi:hypothetical protein
MKETPDVPVNLYLDHDGSLVFGVPCPYGCDEIHLHPAGRDFRNVEPFLGYSRAQCENATPEIRESGYILVTGGPRWMDRPDVTKLSSISEVGSVLQLDEIRAGNARARRMSAFAKAKRLRPGKT